MVKRSLFQRFVAVLTIAGFLVGCATLRVDVDVYKGPLANREEVQLEQMAVMAVGARPLLVQLRDRLESEFHDGFKPGYEKPHWYKHGYIPQPPSEKWNKGEWLDNEQAIRVNAILGLYEDLEEDPYVSNLIARGQSGVRKYVTAWPILNPKDDFGAEAKWTEIGGDAPLGIRATVAGCDVRAQLDELRKAYKKFLVEPSRPAPNVVRHDWGPIFRAHEALWYRLRLVSPSERVKHLSSNPPNRLPIDVPLGAQSTSSQKADRDASNFAFQTLASSDVVAAHAELLFDDQRSREIFVREIRKIGTSFGTLREATRELLVVSLEGLQYIENVSFESSLKEGRTIDLLARYASGLLQLLHLRLALGIGDSDPTIEAFGQALENRLPSGIYNDYDRWRYNTDNSFDVIRKTIESLLREKPAEYSGALLRSHRLFASVADPTTGSGLAVPTTYERSKLKAPVRRLYGIASGPSEQAVTISPESISEDFETFADNVGRDLLRRGRLPKGLFTHIENYLKLKDIAYPHDVVAEPEEARSVETLDREVAIHRLRDALVRFSEKMLRVANNEHLLSNEDDVKEVVGVYSRGRDSARVTNRAKPERAPNEEEDSVVGEDEDEESATVNYSGRREPLRAVTLRDKPEELDRYVLVLQAIGNSILVQANELQARESHENKIERNFARERLGLQLAYSASPSQILDDIESFIKSRSATGAKSAAQLTTEIAAETTKQRTLEGKDKDGKEIEPVPPNSIPALTAVVDGLKATQTQVAAATTAFDAAKRDRDWFPKADAIPAAPAAPTGLAKLKADFHAFLTKGYKPPDPPKPAVPGGTPAVTVEEAPKSPADLKSVIIGQFGELILAATDNAQVKAVQSIRTAFEAAHQAANATGAIKPSVYLGKINEQLGKTLISRREALAVIPKSGDLTTAQAAVTTAQASLTTIKTTITGLNAQKANATKGENAVKQVQEHRPKVLAVADGRTAPLSGPGVVDELRKALNASKAAANAATKTALQQALDFVALFPTPLEAPIDPSLNSKSSKDVLDDVIALLREEHLKVSRVQGPNSPRALQLKATLEEAHAHRSGMVYIRQASSYLRTSYATSSLQVDPGVSWRNLLGEDAIRGIPLVGEDMYNSARGLTKDRIALVSEIDKQFWQNINSVRVSGAGNTNYVIAKDDIGNWYVKNYSADPEPIIRGAESLAMFAMGGVMETDLLSRVQAARAGEAAPAGTPSLNPLTKVLTRYQSEYAKKTNTDLGELAESLGDTSKSTEAAPKPFANSMTAAIFSQWKASDDIYKQAPGLSTRLQSAGNQHLKPASVLLAKAKIEPTKAKDLIDEIQRDTDTDLTPRDADTAAIAAETDNSPNAVMAQQLGLIEMDLMIPKVNVPLLDAIAKTFEVEKNDGLKKQFAELREALGSPHQGQDIADALQAMRRFHNLLTASIADVDFVSDPKAKLEEAEKKLKELLTAIDNAEKAKSDASTEKGKLDASVPTNTPEIDRLQGVVDAQQAIIDAKTEEKSTAEEAVTTAKGALEAAKKAKVLARNGVTRLVKSEITKFIEKRESSLRAHEDQLSFVGDAAGS